MKKQLMVFALSLVLVGGLAAGASAASTDGPLNSFVRQGWRATGQQAQTCLRAAADLTGLSITEIQSERAQGKSLAAVAESRGISKQTMIDQVVAQRTSALDELKADNQISTAQYEACLANMQQRLQSNLERTDIGPNKGQSQRSQRGGMDRMQGAGQCRALDGGMGFNQGICPYLNAQP